MKRNLLAKKVFCSVVAMGVLSCGYSSAWAADSTILEGDISDVSGDITYIATDKGASDPLGEGANRSYAIAVKGDNAPTITLKDGASLIIKNNLTGTDRNYGIALEDGGDITINANSIIDVEGFDATQVRALRNNYSGKLVLNGNTEVKAHSESGFVAAIDTWGSVENNVSTEFYGDITKISVTSNGGQANAVQVVGTDGDAKVVFGAEKTIIENNSIKSGGNNWANCIIAEGEGAVLEINSADTLLKSTNKDYTAQVINIISDAKMDVNGNIDIIAESNYGTNGFGSYGITNFNKGNINIHTVITDGVAASNSIGILSGGGILNVNSDIETFNIIVEGAGVDRGNSIGSNGTAGIYESSGQTTINAKNFNVTVISGQDTVNSKFDKDAADKLGKDYCTAYGLRVDCNGKIVVGTDTSTVIKVSEGYKDAIGIFVGEFGQYPDYGSGNVNILGDAVVDVTGVTGAKAILSKDEANITLGSEGKLVDLTGEVVSDKGNITIQGSVNNINGTITSTNGGAVNLTGKDAVYNVQNIKADGGTVKFGDNTVVNIDSKYVTEGNAAVTVEDGGTLNVSESSKLHISNAKQGDEYTIVAGSESGWQLENISADNILLDFVKDTDTGDYVIKTSYGDVSEKLNGQLVFDNLVNEALKSGRGAAFDFFNDAASSGAGKEAVAAALNSAANIGEMGATNHATYSMSNIMTDAVSDHLSIVTHNEADKDIWAAYIHNKENVSGISLGGINANYDVQYNGIVVGSDLYNKGKVTAGAALTYADGNINGSNAAASTKNDAEYYGISLYGRIDNGDSAVIGDVSYLHSKNDIEQRNSGAVLTAAPKADAFSIGVKAEKIFEKGNAKFVPYAGLRYMHLGTGNYSDSLGMNYDVDDQNLWLLPVGVTYSQDIKAGAWTVKPVVEVGYVWAMGDRDTSQTVSLNGANDGFGFDVTDSGSFVSRFAIEAEKANVTYGLGYEYQKGDTVKANKWMANINFSF